MKIIIRADRKIGNKNIAEHIFRGNTGHRFHGKRIIEKVVDFLLRSGEEDIFIVSDKDLKINNTKHISLSKADFSKYKGVIDLKFVYDSVKLGKFLKKKESLERAIVQESKTIKNINDFGVIYEKKEWNPISRFYVIPTGRKIALLLSKTKVSPNFITLSNILFGILVSALILLGTRLSLFLFGISVILFYIFDEVDGALARFKSQTSLFGKWIDECGDRIVMNVWYIMIAIHLYLKTEEVFFLIAVLVLFSGEYIYNYFVSTSIDYFKNFDLRFTSNIQVMQSPLSKFLLSFLSVDMKLSFIIISAWINKLEYFILFYAVYINIIWILFFLSYFKEYLTEGDIK